jgi:hypothetical protein
MKTRSLLIATAAIEIGAGLAVAIWPSMTISILLGSSSDSPDGLTVARLAGAALLSLGVACWLARDDTDGRAGSGLVKAMLVYNCGAVAVLAFAGAVRGMSAVALWMAVALHLTMSAWCAVCLNRTPRA